MGHVCGRYREGNHVWFSILGYNPLLNALLERIHLSR